MSIHGITSQVCVKVTAMGALSQDFFATTSIEKRGKQNKAYRYTFTYYSDNVSLDGWMEMTFSMRVVIIMRLIKLLVEGKKCKEPQHNETPSSP